MKVHAIIIKWFFKLGLGSALIYYVLQSKMIDFHLVQSMLSNPRNLWLFLSFQAFSVLCCAMRWFLLVRIQGISISFKKIVELTMIGNFFNTFMPGAVGGDIIKGWYVAGHEPQRKTIAVFTVLFDRVIGLAVIVFYSAAILLFLYAVAKRQPATACGGLLDLDLHDRLLGFRLRLLCPWCMGTNGYPQADGGNPAVSPGSSRARGGPALPPSLYDGFLCRDSLGALSLRNHLLLQAPRRRTGNRFGSRALFFRRSVGHDCLGNSYSSGRTRRRTGGFRYPVSMGGSEQPATRRNALHGDAGLHAGFQLHRGSVLFQIQT